MGRWADGPMSGERSGGGPLPAAVADAAGRRDPHRRGDALRIEDDDLVEVRLLVGDVAVEAGAIGRPRGWRQVRGDPDRSPRRRRRGWPRPRTRERSPSAGARAHARRVPSGDHAGDRSAAGSRDTFRAPVPSGASVQISVCSVVGSHTLTARSAPSGDQSGHSARSRRARRTIAGRCHRYRPSGAGTSRSFRRRSGRRRATTQGRLPSVPGP